MQINEIIMYFMAVGALLGGIDLIFGNRLGYGARFQEAFRLMGPIGLSMAGILCLVPLLSRLLRWTVVPLCNVIGVDPGILGSILAIDMGGYQLSMELADNLLLGKFSGIVVSSILGCTIVFTIPVGLGTMELEDRPWFTHGILLGLVTTPAAIVVGGIVCGLSVNVMIRNFYPLLLVTGLLLILLVKFRDATVRVFQWLARMIQMLATIGLMLGAIRYMTDAQILKAMAPLEDAIQVIGSISIVMLGSLPLAELLQRILKTPLAWIGNRTGLNGASMTGLLLGAVSVVPALVLIPQMDRRGKIVNGAFLVCAASTFAAHLGFSVSVQADMTAGLLAAKLLGGLLGVVIALITTRAMDKQDSGKSQFAP